MNRVQDDMPVLDEAQKSWLRYNLTEQQQRHAAIVADMEALTEQRDQWIDEFLERIQSRGFNYNCDQLRQILKDELPVKPDRPFKVVF